VAYVRPHELIPAKTGLAVTVGRTVLQGPAANMDGVLSDGRRIEASFAREAAGEYSAGSTVTLGVRKAHIYPR
jgi:hypothetical protein